MSATIDRVRELVLPILAELDVDLYDLDYSGGSLKVVLDRRDGLDVNLITAATRAISAAMDEADLIPAAYTLEVSSPGLERALRTPAHFDRAVGEQVKVKTLPGVDGDRRVEGRLTSSVDGTITVTTASGDERTLALDEIERAHTSFDWGPTPKKGGKQGQSKQGQSKKGQPKKGQPKQGEPKQGQAEQTRAAGAKPATNRPTTSPEQDPAPEQGPTDSTSTSPTPSTSPTQSEATS